MIENNIKNHQYYLDKEEKQRVIKKFETENEINLIIKLEVPSNNQYRYINRYKYFNRIKTILSFIS